MHAYQKCGYMNGSNVEFFLEGIIEMRAIMAEQFSRTELLLGKDAIDRLMHSRVAVFGVGGF